MLLALSGQRAGVLFNILQCAGQLPQQRTIQPQISISAKLRKTALEQVLIIHKESAFLLRFSDPYQCFFNRVIVDGNCCLCCSRIGPPGPHSFPHQSTVASFWWFIITQIPKQKSEIQRIFFILPQFGIGQKFANFCIFKILLSRNTVPLQSNYISRNEKQSFYAWQLPQTQCKNILAYCFWKVCYSLDRLLAY